MNFPPAYRKGHPTSKAAFEKIEGTGRAGTVRRLAYNCIAEAKQSHGITRIEMFYDRRFSIVPIRTRNQSIASAVWMLKNYQGPGAPLIDDGPEERRGAAVLRLSRPATHCPSCQSPTVPLFNERDDLCTDTFHDDSGFPTDQDFDEDPGHEGS